MFIKLLLNVPKLPGVPAIPRSAKFPPAARVALGLLQGALWRIFQVQNQWGIFDSKGKPLADPRRFQGLAGDLLNTLGGTTVSTGALDYSKETKVADFPVERGGFASYNKVETAAAPVVTLCMNGNEGDRKKFLDAIDKATKSTDLYSVVTPEVTYIDYAIERYNYQRRSSKGATLLIVDISLKEVRQVSAQYTQSNKNGQVGDTKEAGATPQVDSGKVQAQTPKASTLKSLADKLPGLANKAGSLLQGL